MHIPDGFLDARTLAASAVLSAGAVGLALRQCRSGDGADRRLPLLGMTAAFVFAAQMINFPVLGGTSGHLMGAVLAAVLLGPAAAMVSMTCVLILQCLLFGDGGVLALGANVFNMAVLGTLSGYAVCRLSGGLLPGLRGKLAGAGAGAWVSVVVASASCAGQLALSGTAPAGMVLPAMVFVHMLIGLGEAAITVLVLWVIAGARRDLLEDDPERSAAGWRVVAGWGMILALGLALFASPFACGWPDGLESVAQRFGFETRSVGSLLSAPLPEYRFPGLPDGGLAAALAGGAGTLAVFGVMWSMSGWLIRGRRRMSPVVE
ncbi:MAG: energy-coupling factor ABC transporter permease [Verrucomicrobiae bacterium]|nr:energy-coupling factor ABC transporter permease [Verrucomicrobiae bacterium]